jgi:hypothetical protein
MKDPCDRKGAFEFLLHYSRKLSVGVQVGFKKFSVLMNMLMAELSLWYLTAVVNSSLESECKISIYFRDLSITARLAWTIGKDWIVLMSFTVSGMVVIRFKTMFNDVQ